MKALLMALAGVALVATTHVASGAGTACARFDPAFYSATITNRYFPWARVSRTVLTGREEVDGKSVRIREISIRGNQHINISGALTTYLEVLAYTGRHLDERTKDYFAQGKDGWVYYFGEDVDEFENGKVKHTGAWKVGWNESEPQKFVPPFPARVGTRFKQESVPGVAVEEIEIVAVDETVKTPAGTFRRCVHWKEHDPVNDARAEKWHCPGVGFVKETFEGGFLVLTKVVRG
jgi:hypothetical protein